MRKIRLSFYLLLSAIILSCKGNSVETAEIKAQRIAIDENIEADPEIEEFVAPFKEHLNKTLDSTLAYNPKDMVKSDGDLNTAIGNLMADIVMEQANPIFKSRTANEIDMVLLNYGGIRSGLNKGNISTRSAYALMPFENEIVVTELSGEKINEMLSYLERAKTAHPVSGIQIEMDQNYNVNRAEIKGKKIDEDKTYFVATSDYLQQGGDNMNFLKDPVELYKVDYKLRNAIIDYFKKIDTLKVEKDNRFIRK
ncbi:5'-nucleotidase C-terminal domain-containing protein [Salegentibacter sp. JZCK2]|uniref:5'-nucleotidase C-terminal domain-containing protein n=1 Tax=Salegentibacter tibetensis TaxID=2873600 RepID=UPI001CD02898|nr:5'-nucleotidase [Salegentibacter tibetensis]MBZ9730511.1 5'-nucleotidase C-terminal domain-containing protein [Salegentibacter tibetensis]